MNENFLRNYAKLIVSMGINIEKGQPVVVGCAVDDAYFGRIIAEVAYELGASEVEFSWHDNCITKQYYLNAEDSLFDIFPQYKVERFKYFDDRNAAYIHIESSDPDLLKDADSDRIRRLRKAAGLATIEHRELTMSAALRWTVAAIPSKKWATKVFPNDTPETAFLKLWDAIAKCARVDNDDPIQAWHEHNASFLTRAKYMNDKNFKSLHYKNSLGTDVTLELPDNHIWMGGGEHSKDGKLFFPNLPTEELFSLPKKTGVNGRIVSSMPLAYQGKMIEGIDIEFVDGRAVKYSASTNEEVLKSIIEVDEGSHYLGEIALVPYDSPISNMNLLFYNTLFDENASCHFALGKAYSLCIKDSENMSAPELDAVGVNDSITHVDFMVGTKDLTITAKDADGKIHDIFVDGNFAI